MIEKILKDCNITKETNEIYRCNKYNLLLDNNKCSWRKYDYKECKLYCLLDVLLNNSDYKLK